MRMTANLVGACAVVVVVFTTSASAQTEPKSTGPAGRPTQGGVMAPPVTAGKPTGPSRPVPPVREALPLTTQECKGLGGVVVDVKAADCGSGQSCHRTDQDGVIHHNCIDAKN